MRLLVVAKFQRFGNRLFPRKITHPTFRITDPFRFSVLTVGKIVHKYLFNFFRDNNILTTLQSGFILGDSIVNHGVDIYNTFCKALDEGKEVRDIFCDISKAFDRVWHKGLLFKLRSAGISGSLLS